MQANTVLVDSLAKQFAGSAVSLVELPHKDYRITSSYCLEITADFCCDRRMKRLFPVVYVCSCLIAVHSFAGSATWTANPISGDWNTAENWTPNTVPNRASDTA